MLGSGQIINDRYRIQLWLAEGGQSTVYLAADEKTFNRQVVLKLFKLGVGTSADPAIAKQQFEASARLLSGLNHPGIVQVTDFFFHDGAPVLITEYIPGETLAARLSLEPYGLPEARVLAIADQLCDVLSYLHGQDPPIIYRDLTPGNVILASGDKVKLIDFGIARTFKEGKSSDTEPLGTAGYAPPEQHGKGQTGPYSDVYSLGATLLHAVSGYDPSMTPFVLPRADRVNGDMKTVSPAFADAIAKATEVDIRRRYATVDEFRRALHRRGWGALPRGARVGLVTAALLVGVLFCGGVGAMLASAAGVLNPGAIATPGGPAVAAADATAAAATATLEPPTVTATPAIAEPTSTSAPPTPTTVVPPTAPPTSAPTATFAPTVTSAAPTPTAALIPTRAAPSAAPSPTLTPPPSPTSPPPTPTPLPPTPTALPTPTAPAPTPSPPPTPTSPAPTPQPTATPIEILLPSIGQGDLPQPRLDGVAIPGRARRGQPFEITVWASNAGGAAADRGGSITLSFPGAASVEIADANNAIVTAEPADCNFQNPNGYARVITQDSQCRTVLSYATCLSTEQVGYPIAESWYANWAPGAQNRLRVRVTPREDADAVAVNVRVSMSSENATGEQCNILTAPSGSQTSSLDQQGFPVRQYFVITAGATP